MRDILQDIMARKREEVRVLRASSSVVRPVPHRRVSMRAALAASPTGIIAEFKRRSPSKGWINREADPTRVGPAYLDAGATALSVLTDRDFFGGSLDDLRAVRSLTEGVPVLRKDFILDESQISEAALLGADAVLLIAAALPVERFRQLAAFAHGEGLEVLLEIHDETELPYASPELADMVGVNNRHLGTFHTDVEVSLRLARRLPREMLRVSESGITGPDTVCRLREAGYQGFLVGERFMREADPGEALRAFIGGLKP